MTKIEASKIVGWDYIDIPYPTIKEVERAIENKNAVIMLRWFRFLSPPETQLQANILNQIYLGMDQVFDN